MADRSPGDASDGEDYQAPSQNSNETTADLPAEASADPSPQLGYSSPAGDEANTTSTISMGSSGSGVTIETIIPGNGEHFPKHGDTVTVHFVGTLMDGKKFESSRDRNDPYVTKIGIGQVIKGWDEGVPQLSLGQKAVLTVMADYGYGARGLPPVIPPNSVLRFEVELLKIN